MKDYYTLHVTILLEKNARIAFICIVHSWNLEE